jgi:hypothetical protein
VLDVLLTQGFRRWAHVWPSALQAFDSSVPEFFLDNRITNPKFAIPKLALLRGLLVVSLRGHFS